MRLCVAALCLTSAVVAYSPQTAVSWADQHCSNNDGTLCAEFVSHSLNAGGEPCFSTWAPQLVQCLRNSGWRQTQFPAPEGSVAVYTGINGPYHVALCRGGLTIDQHNPGRCGTTGVWGAHYVLAPPGLQVQVIAAPTNSQQANLHRLVQETGGDGDAQNLVGAVSLGSGNTKAQMRPENSATTGAAPHSRNVEAPVMSGAAASSLIEMRQGHRSHGLGASDPQMRSLDICLMNGTVWLASFCAVVVLAAIVGLTHMQCQHRTLRLPSGPLLG